MRTYQRALLFILAVSIGFIVYQNKPEPAEVFVIDFGNTQVIKPIREGFPKEAQRQMKCLADNIYNEAGNQGYYGMKAVALVTMNRASSKYFPEDVCDVVYQKNRNVCQFSWVCQRKRVKVDPELYMLAEIISRRVYLNYGTLKDITAGALFFHADYVNPRWKYQRTVVIGNHIFYKRGDSNDDAKT